MPDLLEADLQSCRKRFWIECGQFGPTLVHELHPSTGLLIALNVADSTWGLLNTIVKVSAQDMAAHLSADQLKELKLLLQNRGLYLGMTDEHFREAFGNN